MWVIISIFISSIDEPASIKHVGYPFETVTECEMALSEYLIDPSHKMARDEDERREERRVSAVHPGAPPAQASRPALPLGSPPPRVADSGGAFRH